MSTINTNGINVNYPVPGVNNNSQGFRDNFASIKTNLDTAATEISDLQNKVVVKSALANTALNNDMGNTLISNAAIRSFRATTYNLGNSLSGTVVVDCSLGDVQFGTVSANTTFQFCNWTPAGTQGNIQLQLAVSNAASVITFPSSVVNSNNNFGVTTLENYASGVGNVPTVSIPNGVSQLDYRLSSTDCGTTVNIEPYNRPRIATQVQQRSPSPVGLQGDVAGTVAVDTNYMYVCTGSYAGSANNVTVLNTTAVANTLTISNTTLVNVNDPIMFQGANVTYANLAVGTVYYVKSIVSPGANGTISVSSTRVAGVAGANVAITATANAFVGVAYTGPTIWKKAALTTW